MTDWYQQSLTPPSAIECRIRLGLVPEREHAQVMVEIFDPSTRVQIAAWSIHHVPLSRWQGALEQAVQKAEQYVGENVEPF
jgi:hypothetical protein